MKKTLSFIIFLVLILNASACAKQPTTYKELMDIHIDHWSQVDNVIEDGVFLLYYYSPHCPDCKSIESDVVSFINKNKNDIPIYLMISMDVEQQGIPPTELRSVPALFVYQDKVFVEMILGPSNVKNYLQNLN